MITGLLHLHILEEHKHMNIKTDFFSRKKSEQLNIPTIHIKTCNSTLWPIYDQNNSNDNE